MSINHGKPNRRAESPEIDRDPATALRMSRSQRPLANDQMDLMYTAPPRMARANIRKPPSMRFGPDVRQFASDMETESMLFDTDVSYFVNSVALKTMEKSKRLKEMATDEKELETMVKYYEKRMKSSALDAIKFALFKAALFHYRDS